MSAPRRRKNILVVGDWAIDEHWLVATHRSRTSSRIGEAHYRSIQNLDSTVTGLCGAALTAGILHRAGNRKHFYNVTGVGLWHHNDKDYLKAIFDPAALKGRTPHQVCPNYKLPKTGLPTLVNLAEADGKNMEPGTARVIRLYEQTGSDIKLLERIDWELQEPENGWYTDAAKKRLKALFRDTTPKAIVVMDLLKGVLTDTLVQVLAERFPQAEWFLFSKSYELTWRTIIDRKQIRLIEIPETAARGSKKQWLTVHDRPSQEGLEALDKFTEPDQFPNATLVVAPNNRTILACRKNPADKEGALWVKLDRDQNSEAPQSEMPMPMSSVCFAAMVGNMLLQKRPQPLRTLLDRSVYFTRKWQTQARKRLKDPLRWNPTQEPVLPLKPEEAKRIEASRDFKIEPLNLQQRLDRWNASYDEKGFGVIKDGGRPRIELWRAMTLVKDYVCLTDTKRKSLQQILHQLDTFAQELRRGEAATTRSCMMIAGPGLGKSFLAQRLAEDHGLAFLEFNMTQMTSRADVLNCFAAIESTQFETRERLLVFVDEMDAYVEGEPVYDAFLDPLERGVYRKDGRLFPIEPCFWLFAGTSDPRNHAKNRKGDDFVSRLTLRPVRMKPKRQENWQLENVYLGVALLRKKFSDVREVSQEVLKAFYEMPYGFSIRELRQCICEFDNVQSGEVRFQNIPTSWHQRLGIKNRAMKDSSRMVEIIEEPTEESATESASVRGASA